MNAFLVVGRNGFQETSKVLKKFFDIWVLHVARKINKFFQQPHVRIRIFSRELPSILTFLLVFHHHTPRALVHVTLQRPKTIKNLTKQKQVKAVILRKTRLLILHIFYLSG